MKNIVMLKKEFIVVDTEGKDELKEIAIIDSKGELIYEAFNVNYLPTYDIKLTGKKLVDILSDFQKIAHNKLIICHNAQHDINIFKRNFKQLNINLPKLNFQCTLTLAKKYFPSLNGYSLESLSKQLNLKVNNQYFNTNLAHTARYDAIFTYQLYLKIREKYLQILLKDKPFPFNSIRVDNPFQDHLDLKEIYQSEFLLIKAIINEIKNDRNYQSKGVVVIGKPGSGKTHLMMRLAKEILTTNRLLFIRQPNNSKTVLYHIYSRILESFIEEVPNTNYTQLEHLLAHCFSQIIKKINPELLTNKDKEILTFVESNHLNLYESLGAEGTQKKRDYWLYIEKKAKEWWLNQYGMIGYASEIITGIIKFCSYSERKRKELVTRWLAGNELDNDELKYVGLNNWNQEISQESFALEAISVFSKLSILDQPLVIVFDQLEGLGLTHNKEILLSFGEAVKEIFTHIPNSLIILNLFPDRWEQFKEFFDASIVDRISQNQVFLHRPSDSKIKEILNLKSQFINIDIDVLFTNDELQSILNHHSIRTILNNAASYYRHKIHGLPLPNNNSVKTTPETNINNSPDLEKRVIKIEQQLSQLQHILKNLGEVFTNFSLPNAPLSEFSTIKNNNQSLVNNNKESNQINEEVIVYLEQQKTLIEEEYHKNQIIDDNDDIGKLKTIAESFATFNDFTIDYVRLGKKKIPENLLIIKQQKQISIGFLQISGSSFTARIKNYNQLVINNKNIHFVLWRDQRQSNITGAVGKSEIDKLNNSQNGTFKVMGKEERIDFELLYKLIIDIQNKDLEMQLESALYHVISYFKNSWIIKIFT